VLETAKLEPQFGFLEDIRQDLFYCLPTVLRKLKT